MAGIRLPWLARAACALTLAVVGCNTPGRRAQPAVLAHPNDNRVPAGVWHGDTLTLRLVAVRAEWRPAADSGPGIPIAAFAEEGHEPSNPGPLLRVPLGTHVELTIRNAVDDTLVFCEAFNNNCVGADTVRILPAATSRRSFVADRVGTFYYAAGRLSNGHLLDRVLGHQLVGAFVVDPGGTARRDDRIFVITSWQAADTNNAPFVQGINGRNWPFTERFDAAVGDSLHWRFINATDTPHPMHLHGFHFRLVSHGDLQRDTAFAPGDQQLEVTEEVIGSSTISWSPTRPGNWLFHCHKTAHMSYVQHAYLERRAPPDTMADHSVEDHATMAMGGMILGVHVRGSAPTPAPAARVDSVRLVIQERARFHADGEEALGFAIEPPGSRLPPDSVVVPGPLLSLTRGMPVVATVVNRLRAPTTVHWHGIEVESYYDGVAGWSGVPGSLAPMIAPGDSFVARFTPPRSGTYMYHAHINEARQIGTGMFGPIVVHDEGARFDPRTDHVLMLSQAGRRNEAQVVVNRGNPADTLFLPRDAANRLRLANITLMDDARISLREGEKDLTWQPVAKDGADLPPSARTERRARRLLGPGEIADFMVRLRPGRYSLHVESFNTIDVPIVVR